MPKSKEQMVLVQISSESEYIEGPRLMTKNDADRCKKLLSRCDEWPEEVNDILDRSPIIKLYGTLDTSGDSYGWDRCIYSPQANVVDIIN